MSSFWNSCLSQFEQELPPQQFNTWIRPLRLEGEDDFVNGLRLLAPNGFILKWVKERYLSRIEELGSVFFSSPVSVLLVLGERAVAASSPAKSLDSGPVVVINRPGIAPGVVRAGTERLLDKVPSLYEKTRLIPGFTFENLIVGKANDLARAASVQVAINPGGAAYNPMFIYGGAGLGKTHLIHAIGNHILEQNPAKVVRYVHAEDYYSDA